MNYGVPSTDLACDAFMVVLSPKSPILISPEFEFMNMLSHFISLWIMGVSCSWRYCNPFKISLAHVLMTFNLGCLIRFKYWCREPPVTSSVMNITSSLSLTTQADMKWIILSCFRFLIRLISSMILFFSPLGRRLSLITFQATSLPVSWSIAL